MLSHADVALAWKVMSSLVHACHIMHLTANAASISRCTACAHAALNVCKFTLFTCENETWGLYVQV